MQELRDKVKELWSGQYIPAHDLKHTRRVAALARHIALGEGYGDPDEAEAAGLLHDLGRLAQREEAGHAQAGLAHARDLLERHTAFSPAAKEHILSAVGQHSLRRSVGLLANILQDADKLDGLGAIGLMRAYTSKAHLPDYPEGAVERARPDQRELTDGSHFVPLTISHQIAFQMEWFAMLYTHTAQRIAGPRRAFMEEFMNQLRVEVAEAHA